MENELTLSEVLLIAHLQVQAYDKVKAMTEQELREFLNAPASLHPTQPISQDSLPVHNIFFRESLRLLWLYRDGYRPDDVAAAFLDKTLAHPDLQDIREVNPLASPEPDWRGLYEAMRDHAHGQEETIAELRAVVEVATKRA